MCSFYYIVIQVHLFYSSTLQIRFRTIHQSTHTHSREYNSRHNISIYAQTHACVKSREHWYSYSCYRSEAIFHFRKRRRFFSGRQATSSWSTERAEKKTRQLSVHATLSLSNTTQHLKETLRHQLRSTYPCKKIIFVRKSKATFYAWKSVFFRFWEESTFGNKLFS